MLQNHVMPGGRVDDAARWRDVTERLPGLIFQLHRDRDGHLAFPYLAGSSTDLPDFDREPLSRSARPLFDRVDPRDSPYLMDAIERSARWGTPLATRFRFRLPDRRCRWIAIRAQPEPLEAGVLWHGMLIDITEQMAEEARLRQLSDTDDLTGLANRRKLIARLNEATSQSNRHGTQLSLMLLDIDHFKQVNDTLGHLRGDQLLIDVAALCRQLLRQEDTIGRLGGDEFAMVLPFTPLARCRLLADRLRQRIIEHDFGTLPNQITVSIGLAEYRLGESQDSLIERADRGLYAAKHRGRNRVMAC
jgi:diguanylate cyclase (GGDEF)-like protein